MKEFLEIEISDTNLFVTIILLLTGCWNGVELKVFKIERIKELSMEPYVCDLNIFP